MTAYDTTGRRDDEYIAGAVLSGLIELMESDFERVITAGARYVFTAQEAMIDVRATALT